MKNAPINPILRLIYGFFKLLTRITLPLYFRNRFVRGKEHLRFDGPAFIAVNHPNTLMDVLNSGLHVRQEMFFLANYGLFRHWFTNWFFSTLFCIPVKRREDMRPGETRNNNVAFEQCYKHFEKNGVIFIAPEGSSWMRRFVGFPLKQGIARISFGAERRNNWELGLKIIPIGLTYDRADAFRSRTAVCAGEPLIVADWKKLYERSEEDATEDLLEAIYLRLIDLSIDTRHPIGEKVISNIEELINNPKRQPWQNVYDFIKEKGEDWLDDMKLQNNVENYFNNLYMLSVTDRAVCWKIIGKSTLKPILLLILGAPLAIPAYFFWNPTLFVPWAINRYSGLYIGYSSTVKLLSAIVFFPFAFWFLYNLSRAWLSPSWSWFVVVLMFFLGFFLEHYDDLWNAVIERRKLRKLGQSVQDDLVRRRKQLVQTIIIDGLKTSKVKLPGYQNT